MDQDNWAQEIAKKNRLFVMKLEKLPPAYLTETILRPGEVPKRTVDSGGSGGTKANPISVKNVILFSVGFVVVSILFCVGSSVGLLFLSDYQIRQAVAEIASADNDFYDKIGEIEANELGLLMDETLDITEKAREDYVGGKFYMYDLVTAAEGDEVKFLVVYQNSTATLTGEPLGIFIIYNDQLLKAIDNR